MCADELPPAVHQEQQRQRGIRRLHLANERTFLSWLRAALGLMGLGFIVQRFNLFARQLAYLAPGVPQVAVGPPHLGSGLLILGAMLAAVATVRFVIVEREIESDTYRPQVLFNVVVGIVLLSIGLLLAVSMWIHF